jgi:hypothetical protein
MQRKFFKHTPSTAGAVLVGLGLFIFCWNLDRAVTQLGHTFGTIPRQALGVLPSVIVAASRIAQACAANHQQVLRVFLLHTLASAWPLLLVVVGALLSRDSFPD